MAGADSDDDGLFDEEEQALAERYAPIVYHSSDESNFPTNVDWLLSRTSLWFYDDSREPDLRRKLVKRPTQLDLVSQIVVEGCEGDQPVRSDGTRSRRKQRTFFLQDVAEEHRAGSLDSSDWTTYFHAYLNDDEGVTLQYWRLYSYNDAGLNHGGDWECVQVILTRSRTPVRVALLGHSGIQRLPASALEWEGTHPRVYSEGGGHATRPHGKGIRARGCGGGWLGSVLCELDSGNPATFVRQETWPGGEVAWFGGRCTRAGALLNMGEKRRPMNEQLFIQYSGLWGSPGVGYESSGYWGPAYNETDMRSDGFIVAWAEGMKGVPREECYPSSYSR
ncbi:hypothetical protein [Sorangium sp. So ce542]|uniref:hypothetical protein n=1 Tax=Sorangium sp. So ce542 TaxID=3133316 RepID=UPI003F61AB04